MQVNNENLITIITVKEEKSLCFLLFEMFVCSLFAKVFLYAIF